MPAVVGLVLVLGPSLPAPAATPAERLAGATRIPTITHQDPGALDEEAFLGFHRFLQEMFPRVHAELPRTVVGDYSLLFEWRGKEPERQPILLTSHLDVVP